jgi:hypothetical protein
MRLRPSMGQLGVSYNYKKSIFKVDYVGIPAEGNKKITGKLTSVPKNRMRRNRSENSE